MIIISVIDWLERNMTSCFWKKYFGIECPGCGMQRAIIALLKGDFLESLRIYPALIPTILMVILLILHLIFKFRKGAFYLKISFIFTVSIIVLNYLYKIIFLGIH